MIEIVREAGFITIGCIHIGCIHKTVEWWQENHAKIGAREGYTETQIREYRGHIDYCRAWMERREGEVA